MYAMIEDGRLDVKHPASGQCWIRSRVGANIPRVDLQFC